MDELRTILLAAGDEDLREFVRITLEGPTTYIWEARDAVTALRLAKAAIPDLVLLDTTIPGLDGPELARLLARDSETAEIKVVVLVEGDAVEGVDACLVRPFGPEELVQTVEAALASG